MGGREGSQKEYSVYAFDNVDKLPLNPRLRSMHRLVGAYPGSCCIQNQSAGVTGALV